MSDKDRGAASLDPPKPKAGRGSPPALSADPSTEQAGGESGIIGPRGASAEAVGPGDAADPAPPADRDMRRASEPVVPVTNVPAAASSSDRTDQEGSVPQSTPERDGQATMPSAQGEQGEPYSESASTGTVKRSRSDHVGAGAPGRGPPPPPRSGRHIALAALLLSVLLPGALYAYLAGNGVFNREDGRISRLEQAVAALRAAPAPKVEVSRADVDKLVARVDQIDRSVAALAQRPAAVMDGQSGDTDAAEQAKKAAESAASAQSAAAKVESLEIKIADLEKRLVALEQAVSERRKPLSNAPSMLVLARTVTNDLASGAPFSGELDALARLGADPKLIEALRPFADKGAPSLSSLAADFEGELSAARAKVAGSAAPSGFWDRVANVLGHLVRVHNIGGDEAGTPATTVTAALARGDLAAAADGWNSLPVFEKSATPASGGRIKALASANEAARRLGEEALEAIRRAGSAENGG
jgi:hypothetical protein